MTSRLFIIIIFYGVSECSNLRGRPVPKAEVLEYLLTKYTGSQDYTGAVFDYLKGNEPTDNDNLDISVLDAQNVQKIIQMTKRKYTNTRRGRESRNHPLYFLQGKKNPNGNAIIKTCMDMMKQSIYATRYRMQDTKRFRKIMTNDISYNIGIFYGALMEITLKLNSLFASMKKHKPYTYFMWFLVIYEKILAGNIDIHNMVDRIYYLNDIYVKRMRGNVDLPIAPTIPPATASTKRRRKVKRSTIKRMDNRGIITGSMPGADFVHESIETRATTVADSVEETVPVEEDETDMPPPEEESDRDNKIKEEDNNEKNQNATDNSPSKDSSSNKIDTTDGPAEGKPENPADKVEGNEENNKGNVEDNKENVEDNKGNVEDNKENVEDNKGNVEDNKGNVEDNKENVEDNKGNVEDNKGNVEDNKKNVEDNKGNVEDNKGNVEDNKGNVEDGTEALYLRRYLDGPPDKNYKDSGHAGT